jgi:hypothetical protein
LELSSPPGSRCFPSLDCRRQRRVGRRTAPLRRKQHASNVCRLLSAFVVGPELERAQGRALPRRVKTVLTHFAPSARALRQHGRFLGLGGVRSSSRCVSTCSWAAHLSHGRAGVGTQHGRARDRLLEPPRPVFFLGHQLSEGDPSGKVLSTASTAELTRPSGSVGCRLARPPLRPRLAHTFARYRAPNRDPLQQRV